jgi:uncharacterized membrane protein
MNLNFLGPFHPQIVHTPVALLIFSAFFAILARLFDRDWLKKTAVLLLVFGFLGAFLAEQSGKPAHRVPERQQGVPEVAIDTHAAAAKYVTWTSGAALLALAVATRLRGGFASALSVLALVLQIMSAVAVGRTAYLGGKLVFDHGANVKVDGVLVKSAKAGEHTEGEPGQEGAERR